MTSLPRPRSLCRTCALLVVLAILFPQGAPPAAASEPAGCIERAAAWADVHPTLLRAIAWVESRGNPAALNWNTDAAGTRTSYDVGLMQINSWWYERGLKDLWLQMGDPCVNVAAGAWVLRQCVDQYGYTWNAVGCYNAGAGWVTSKTRRGAGRRYIQKVRDTLTTLLFSSNGINVQLTESPIHTTMPE